jgi:hypothetical protein
MQNHVLLAHNGRDVKGTLCRGMTRKNCDGSEGSVTWDGKEILKKDGVYRPASGIQLSRKKGNQFLSIVKASGLFKTRLCADGACAGGDRSDAQNLAGVLKTLSKTSVYQFKLPDNVEVIVIFVDNDGLSTDLGNGKTEYAPPGAEVLIRMPPQQEQDGWCGNFNGKRGDYSNGVHSGARRRKIVNNADDLFLKAGIGGPQLMQLSGKSAAKGNYSAESRSCDAELLEKAKSACDHLAQDQIRESCISDACTTGRVEASVLNADDMSVMMAIGSLSHEGRPGGQGACKCD